MSGDSETITVSKNNLLRAIIEAVTSEFQGTDLEQMSKEVAPDIARDATRLLERGES